MPSPLTITSKEVLLSASLSILEHRHKFTYFIGAKFKDDALLVVAVDVPGIRWSENALVSPRKSKPFTLRVF